MSDRDPLPTRPRSFPRACAGLAMVLAAWGCPALAQAGLDALSQPVPSPPLDLEAIANGYEAIAPPVGTAALRPAEPALLIFVSFAMPESTLKRLAEQAQRARATLILRGLVAGSMVQTVARVQRITAGRPVSFQIDPQAFDRFAIRRTPSFVLIRDAESERDCKSRQCATADTAAVTAGDVSLDYALEALRRASPHLSREAERFLQRLRSRR